MKSRKYIRDYGEKQIISTLIKPLYNAANNPNLVGDDCAVLKVPEDYSILLSTDRVPADLTSFKLKIINYKGLGYYLAILNLSDIAASGGSPIGLLLNFAFPNNFLYKDLKSILEGVKLACEKYECNVLGGDLSYSSEISISATAVGKTKNPLYRTGAMPGDLVYCSNFAGLTAAAFKYFNSTRRPKLTIAEINTLKSNFKQPRPMLDLGNRLSMINDRITAMDNTDGFGQTLLEIGQINNLKVDLSLESIPFHPVSLKICSFYGINEEELICSPGADFQLIGTIPKAILEKIPLKINIIGEVSHGSGVTLRVGNSISEIEPRGWNYFE